MELESRGFSQRNICEGKEEEARIKESWRDLEMQI